MLTLRDFSTATHKVPSLSTVKGSVKDVQLSADVVTWLRGEELKYVHMVSLAVDFYLANYLKNILSKNTSGVYGFNPSTQQSVFITNDIKFATWGAQLQESTNNLTAWQDSFMFTYLCAAVAGELRHANTHGKLDKDGIAKLKKFKIYELNDKADLDRSSTQKRFLKHVQSDMLLEFLTSATEIFRQKVWSSGFGGEKWGMIAETGLLRYTKALDPTSFVDRVYDLKHNGGPMFDKNKAVRNDKLQVFLDEKFSLNHETEWASWLRYVSKDMLKCLNIASSSGIWKRVEIVPKSHYEFIAADPNVGSKTSKEKIALPTCNCPDCTAIKNLQAANKKAAQEAEQEKAAKEFAVYMANEQAKMAAKNAAKTTSEKQKSESLKLSSKLTCSTGEHQIDNTIGLDVLEI